MLPAHYIWFAWSSLFLVCWGLAFAACPPPRNGIWWGSFIGLAFALSEPCFVGLYWTPPSLFNLAGRFHFDLESFIFCFAIGGIGSAIYNVTTRRAMAIPIRRRGDARRQQWYNAALASGPILFGPLLVLTNEPLLSGVIAMASGGIARLLVLPALRAKTCIGSVLFALFYGFMFLVLDRMAPGYIGTVWSAQALKWGWIGPAPLIEIAFGLSFGLFWSGLYEQVVWTLTVPERAPANRPLAREIEA